MARLKAPEGCKHFSYEGRVFDVDADGFVEVTQDQAVALRPHGFVSPDEVVVKDIKDDVRVKRDDVHEMLGHLGIAISDAANISPAKLVEMLKAGVKMKAAAVAKAADDVKAGAEKAVSDVKTDEADKSAKKRG